MPRSRTETGRQHHLGAGDHAVKLLAATGMLGSGFLESSIARGVDEGAAMIGCDSGTTDFGPHLLATGRSHFSRSSVRRDLGIMIEHARRTRIPVVIGSAGGSGSDSGVAWMSDIVREIADQLGLHFSLAQIHAEQPAHVIRELLAQGRVRALPRMGELTGEDVDSSLHMVAMMGAEPIQEALSRGADVVVAGRASDASIFAALPLLAGHDPGLCWHAGKILECGAAAVVQRTAPDSMQAEMHASGVDIEPLRPDYRCTPQSVASHTLYENADPFNLIEPSGVLDTLQTRYDAISDRAVRISGSRFHEAAEYTVKLEGARKVGYSTVIPGAIRDPLIINQLDAWLATLDAAITARLRQTLTPTDTYTIATRVYGRNGVMGELEPVPRVEGHEVMLLWDVISGSQELSHSIAAALTHMAAHNPIPEWHGLISGVAFPFAPSEIDRGPVYEFHLNHVIVPESPTALFPIDMTVV
ncbi:MAG: acyclic terpene utilization AtuA family protein [Candidatus Dormiibacterota bacterium]